MSFDYQQYDEFLSKRKLREDEIDIDFEQGSPQVWQPPAHTQRKASADALRIVSSDAQLVSSNLESLGQRERDLIAVRKAKETPEEPHIHSDLSNQLYNSYLLKNFQQKSRKPSIIPGAVRAEPPRNAV